MSPLGWFENGAKMKLSTRHEQTDENGIGKCSVPMWMGGTPGGFCDDVAYGRQEPSQRRYGDFDWQRKWIPGYCSGLACYAHGGPRSRVFRDGSSWVAVWLDFIDLQESHSGFGDTPEAARLKLETVTRSGNAPSSGEKGERLA